MNCFLYVHLKKITVDVLNNNKIRLYFISKEQHVFYSLNMNV